MKRILSIFAIIATAAGLSHAATIYIANKAGYTDVALYAWSNDKQEAFGGWPGARPGSSVTVNGVVYDIFSTAETGDYNLIYNYYDANAEADANGEVKRGQLGDKTVNLTTGGSYFFEAYTDGMKDVDNPGIAQPSEYGLHVWPAAGLAGDEYQEWDVSGDLYAPYGSEYHTDRKTVVSGAYPLSDRFRGTSPKNETLLKFCGPLSDDEMKNFGGHAFKWASTDYPENGKDILKYDTESKTELYVIDFTEGNDLKGIYVRVPKVKDMNLKDAPPVTDGNGTANTDVEALFRMGYRFEMIDTKYSGDNPIDHHRYYVKWGHCFRLNEMSRPLNAFVKYNTDGTSYYVDEFGLGEWNGIKTNDSGFSDAKFESATNYGKKRGDNRILSERNFWLKRIFLEVAADEDHPDDKRFYISFDGEYDLSENADSHTCDFFIPATGNFASKTPNIWFGADMSANEAAFSRFYNLNQDGDVSARLGISWDEYEKQTKQGHLFYGLEFTDPYSVTSSYKALDAEGNVMKYKNGDEISKTFSYKGEDGKFVRLNEEDKEVEITPVQNGEFTSLNAFSTAMMFDPGDEEQEIASNAPAKVSVESRYTFPNQAFETVNKDEYSFGGERKLPEAEMKLNAEAVGRGKTWKTVSARVDWTDFGSLTGATGLVSRIVDGEGDRAWPVAGYMVKVAPSFSEDTPAEDAYEIAYDDRNGWWRENPEFKGVVKDSKTNFVYKLKEDEQNKLNDGDEKNFYLHFRVEAYYNLCYPETVLKTDRLFSDLEHGTPGELLGTSLADEGTEGVSSRREFELESLTGTHNEGVGSVKYRIEPHKAVAENMVAFDNNTKITTGVGSVEADSEARYYDLRGVEISGPIPGQVCVELRGGEAKKIIVLD